MGVKNCLQKFISSFFKKSFSLALHFKSLNFLVGYLCVLHPVRVIKFHFRMIKMKIRKRTLILCFLLLATASAGAQSQEKPLRIFGYFQNSFQQWTAFEFRPKQNSFSLQQLNLFFQKDLGTNWTAFVNFEFLNNFSSSRQWGSANLEETWVKYRASMRFNLKLGLLVPIFNNLHEIKNRTPLLPYIIRPLAYETSFSEFILKKRLAKGSRLRSLLRNSVKVRKGK